MILLNPGPVMVSKAVRESLLRPDICHREDDFVEIMNRVRKKLTDICKGDKNYASVVFTGSGTASLEATLSSSIGENDKMLIIDNGIYGKRMREIANVYKINAEALEFNWGESIDIDEIERILNADTKIKVVAMVHHETSTGMLNSINEVGGLTKKYMKTFIVDAISSIGGENLDVNQDNIDFCIGTANKCIEGLPGLSFVCAKRDILEELRDIPPKTFYLNLYNQYYSQEILKETPFTPAVQMFFALDTALNELLSEGVENRCKRYSQMAKMVRKGLKDLGFKFLLSPQYQSNTLTAVLLPKNMTYRDLHDKLKEKGFIIYAGQKGVHKKIFRIANMGNLSKDDIRLFLESFEDTILELGVGKPEY